ncbi:hypothetical protein [Listeria monocytogenes]|uniref:hypothetical protein n=1 Tax=Listeria monocytogenes TaxID=1639 RepID=UPI000874F3D7|nr:hypothetical protein [Listeria monocytogenes]EAC7998117.1 hypothetical protein [Listeria monocytogenes]EAC8350562.1 hypothetical protein [Listeria monocytogenes]EAD0739952.1 hypothetical protein [Listeria monocytogenes]EAD9140313.1 hypothetical protein [Listeria monocytogenes]EIL9239380.1 hypothetical protein [Listeria monocytogenes]
MWIDFETFRSLLKRTGISVYRDRARKNEEYPYIVYTHAFEKDKRASNKLLRNIKTFQVSFYTAGTEKDIDILRDLLNANQISYLPFQSQLGDENDSRITNFFTYIDVVYDGK